MKQNIVLFSIALSFMLSACSGLGGPAKSVATTDKPISVTAAKKIADESKAAALDAAKEAAAKEAAAQLASKELAAKEQAAKDALAKETAAKEAAAVALKEASAKEEAAKEAAAKEVLAKETAAKEAAAKATSAEAVNKELADKDKAAFKIVDKSESKSKDSEKAAAAKKANEAKEAKKKVDDEDDENLGGSVIQKGIASWYGTFFHGRLTANGERYDKWGMTAAHKTLPFGTKLKVTNLKNGRSVVVRVNDRGPYVKPRIIDLSQGAAQKLGIEGIAQVALTKLN